MNPSAPLILLAAFFFPQSAAAQDTRLLDAAGKAIGSFVAAQFGAASVHVSPEVHDAAPATWSIEAYAALHASLGLPMPEPLPTVEVIRTCGFGCDSPATVRTPDPRDCGHVDPEPSPITHAPPHIVATARWK